MAWRFVRQPNGKLARFSDVVDNFTHINLEFDEAVEACNEFGLYLDAARAKVLRADEPGRWEEALKDIETIHGRHARQKYEHQLSGE